MDVRQFVGMRIETATAAARQAGLEVALETTGPQSLNCEYRAGRVNFKVQNGVVVDAHVG